MSHSGTRRVIQAWSDLPEAHRIPSRASLDPTALSDLLPQIFMAEQTETGLGFRLAGAWMERLFGGSLRGVHWLPLWERASRLDAHRAVTRAFRECRPMIVAAEMGETDEPVEIVLCPLRGPSGAADRILGLIQPLSLKAVGLKDVSELRLIDVEAACAPGRVPLSLAALDGRLIA